MDQAAAIIAKQLIFATKNLLRETPLDNINLKLGLKKLMPRINIHIRATISILPILTFEPSMAEVKK